MNKNKLKVYAPQAREEFIKVISERAALYGITEKKIEPFEIKGDYLFISGKPFPKLIDKPRKELIARIESKNFGHVMEEIAYTWFNRFAAIRFMEINGYLEHGYRVLSHPGGHSEPEILEKAHYLESLDGLSKDEIVALKTAGNKDSDLYRKLIIAQCNELHSAMPFLFEKVDDPTELLLPDNLLNTDSITRQLVTAIPEEDWKAVEIIGWLYQFYISEKKDALMKAKKAYKTEDIPAVTQLFTPNWIVKYLVQNTLGAKWLATYPSSKIKEKMEYYIESAEQTDEVKKQLREITPEALNPEELTVMDPACGSGHILVEAYDLLKEIYLERGYRTKDIPALIIKKNLFGLEIDERAAQLAGFALMMKARLDDSRIFSKEHIEPNIVCIQETAGMDITGLLRNINMPLTDKSISTTSGELEFMDEISAPLFTKSRNKEVALTAEEKLTVHDLNELLELFKDAKTFGSLIRIPQTLIEKLEPIRKRLKISLASEDLMAQQPVALIMSFLKQAEILAHKYDCVIANPPYMGGKGMNSILKEYLGHFYEGYEKDLFSAFIMRGRGLAKEHGCLGFMSPFVWMFISSYENLRKNLIDHATLTTLIQLEYSGFAEATVPICAFTFNNAHSKQYAASFIRLSDFRGAEYQAPRTLEAIRNRKCGWFYDSKPIDFKKIPGSPIAYWVSNRIRDTFSNNVALEELGLVRQGASTSDNDRFLRLWYEVNVRKIGFNLATLQEANLSAFKWFPYNKGGSYRKWYGNQDFVINYADDGAELKEFQATLNQGWTVRLKSREYYFQSSVSWPKISSSSFSARYFPEGFIFDVAGCCYFPKNKLSKKVVVAYLNSKVAAKLLEFLSPTLNFEIEQVKKLPFGKNIHNDESRVEKIFIVSKKDWDSFETSWDFEISPILEKNLKAPSIRESFLNWDKQCASNIVRMQSLEEENNRIFIEAYGLQDELKPDVSEDEITLARADKANDMKRLISYAVGCMMGRYSLDKPRLIYAHSGNEAFDKSQYKTFPADDDGIIPITAHEWFDDDAASSFLKFIETSWGKKCLDANLDFIAEAIGSKDSESSRDAIRRYFVDSFYKDHCQTYKKRPIYWLFTSGKEKTFQALVYLHRYNESTLSRMRTEYVLPLQTKINRLIDHLDKDKDSANSTSAANKIQKDITRLVRQKEELIKFDELLRHYADMKIKLDLDDGVKVNYGKFGELLDNVKAIAGDKDAEDES